MTEDFKTDQDLSRRLTATLDQAAARPDAALDQALAATRAQALGLGRKPERKRHPWLWASGLALAAGFAAIMVLPQLGPVTPAQPPMSAHNPPTASVPAVDPEMLEDMDMLLAMGEARHEG